MLSPHRVSFYFCSFKLGHLTDDRNPPFAQTSDLEMSADSMERDPTGWEMRSDQMDPSLSLNINTIS